MNEKSSHTQNKINCDDSTEKCGDARLIREFRTPLQKNNKLVTYGRTDPHVLGQLRSTTMYCDLSKTPKTPPTVSACGTGAQNLSLRATPTGDLQRQIFVRSRGWENPELTAPKPKQKKGSGKHDIPRRTENGVVVVRLLTLAERAAKYTPLKKMQGWDYLARSIAKVPEDTVCVLTTSVAKTGFSRRIAKILKKWEKQEAESPPVIFEPSVLESSHVNKILDGDALGWHGECTDLLFELGKKTNAEKLRRKTKQKVRPLYRFVHGLKPWEEVPRYKHRDFWPGSEPLIERKLRFIWLDIREDKVLVVPVYYNTLDLEECLNHAVMLEIYFETGVYHQDLPRHIVARHVRYERKISKITFNDLIRRLYVTTHPWRDYEWCIQNMAVVREYSKAPRLVKKSYQMAEKVPMWLAERRIQRLEEIIPQSEEVPEQAPRQFASRWQEWLVANMLVPAQWLISKFVRPINPAKDDAIRDHFMREFLSLGLMLGACVRVSDTKTRALIIASHLTASHFSASVLFEVLNMQTHDAVEQSTTTINEWVDMVTKAVPVRKLITALLSPIFARLELLPYVGMVVTYLLCTVDALKAVNDINSFVTAMLGVATDVLPAIFTGDINKVQIVSPQLAWLSEASLYEACNIPVDKEWMVKNYVHNASDLKTWYERMKRQYEILVADKPLPQMINIFKSLTAKWRSDMVSMRGFGNKIEAAGVIIVGTPNSGKSYLTQEMFALMSNAYYSAGKACGVDIPWCKLSEDIWKCVFDKHDNAYVAHRFVEFNDLGSTVMPADNTAAAKIINIHGTSKVPTVQADIGKKGTTPFEVVGMVASSNDKTWNAGSMFHELAAGLRRFPWVVTVKVLNDYTIKGTCEVDGNYVGVNENIWELKCERVCVVSNGTDRSGIVYEEKCKGTKSEVFLFLHKQFFDHYVKQLRMLYNDPADRRCAAHGLAGCHICTHPDTPVPEGAVLSLPSKVGQACDSVTTAMDQVAVTAATATTTMDHVSTAADSIAMTSSNIDHDREEVVDWAAEVHRHYSELARDFALVVAKSAMVFVTLYVAVKMIKDSYVTEQATPIPVNVQTKPRVPASESLNLSRMIMKQDDSAIASKLDAIAGNTVRLRIKGADGVVRKSHGFFLLGKVLIIPRHSFTSVSGTLNVEPQGQLDQHPTVDYDLTQCYMCAERDIVAMTYGNRDYKKLEQFFCAPAHYSVAKVYADGAWLTCGDFRTTFETRDVIGYRNGMDVGPVFKYDIQKPGYSGAPVVAYTHENSCALVGFHVAGTASGAGFVVMVSVNDVKKIISFFATEHVIEMNSMTVAGKDLYTEEVSRETWAPYYKGYGELVAMQQPHVNTTRSHLLTSWFYDAIGARYGHEYIAPDLTKSHVREPNGEWVYRPVEVNSISKRLTPPPQLDEKLVRQALDIMHEMLETSFAQWRFLDLEQATFGNPNWRGLSPLDFNTSSGQIDTGPKRNHIENGWWKQHVLDRHKRVYDQCVRLIDPNFIVWPSRKDEVIKRTKFETRGPRVFYCGDLVMTLLARQVFLPLITLLIRNRNIPIAAGINACGKDWAELLFNLTDGGRLWLMVDEDVKSWDDSVYLVPIVKLLHEGLRKSQIYGEERNVAHVLVNSLQSYVAYYQGTYVRLHRGMPSGHPFTTIGNCLANIFYSIYGFLRMGNDRALWWTHVRIITYGDDKVWAMDEQVCFSGSTLADTMAECGLETTSGNKNGPPRLAPLEEITFLKRGFYRVDGRVLAPLAEDSLWKSLLFVDDKNNIAATHLAIVDSVLREAVLHGKEKFAEWYETLHELVEQAGMKWKYGPVEAEYESLMGKWEEGSLGVWTSTSE